MSELAKIKNKIQEAAGTNVNIIEGIGIDSELGMAISVTVIATGFEEKRKPKNPTTINLEEDSLDNILDLNSDELKISNNDNTQQKLLLEDDIIVDTHSEKDINIENKEAIISSSVSQNISKPIVLNLENDDLNELESPEDIINSIVTEEKNIEQEAQVETNVKGDLISSETSLNTDEENQLNTDFMKVESRERENRLRSLSMQLRTPSGLTSLEDIPAYKRNNVEITESNHSSESEISTYTLTNNNENSSEVRKNNSFLHDNVD